MTLSEADIEQRLPVWDSMQMLFMDTDPADELPHVARVCAGSTYSLAELRDIFMLEVFPACRFNLFGPVPEWRGFEIEALSEHILAKQRHGKRLPLLLGRRYSEDMWLQLAEETERRRGSAGSESDKAAGRPSS